MQEDEQQDDCTRTGDEALSETEVDPQQRAERLRNLSDEAAADLPPLTLKQIRESLISRRGA